MRVTSIHDEANLYFDGTDDKVDQLIAENFRKPNLNVWLLQGRSLEHEGYFAGDILLVDKGEMAKPGDVVIAEIKDWKSNGVATAIRIYEPPYIVAASSDRNLRRLYAVDQEQVSLEGVVIAAIKPRRISTD